MPAAVVHRKACIGPSGVVLYPTTSPLTFTPRATLRLPPSVPRSTIPPPAVHEKAWNSVLDVWLYPTT